LTHEWLTDRFLFCCLSQEQQALLREELDEGRYRAAYLNQQNLVKEKTGYRCSTCGRFYPMVQILYRGEAMAPERFAKLPARPVKHRKAALAFLGDHYYAVSKKTLLKFCMGEDGTAVQTDEIPVMGGVYHAALSEDEQYLATLTLGGTLAVIDAAAKQTIARKRGMTRAYVFAQEHRLLYYHADAIRCWDFAADTEEIIWQVPAAWKEVSPVLCHEVTYSRADRTCRFHLTSAEADWAVVVSERAEVRVIGLPHMPAGHQLAYMHEQRALTLSAGDRILVLDENGQVREKHDCPKLLKTGDGGAFPVTRFMPQGPRRVFLSPDGKWFLLDYASAIILMDRADGTIRYCKASCTGQISTHMGFADARRFWYVWGDTTWVQALPDQA